MGMLRIIACAITCCSLHQPSSRIHPGEVLTGHMSAKLASRTQSLRLLGSSVPTLTVGYQLDKSQFEATKAETGRHEGVLYIIPGGFMTTPEMLDGKNMEKEAQSIVEAAG